MFVHEKLPDFSLSLWQAEQVLLMKACCEEGVEKVSEFCASDRPARKNAAQNEMKILS